ncbi:MAG: ATP-binding protein [Acidobacteriota bacterium]
MRTCSDQDRSPEQYLSQHHELQILFDISSALHCSPHLQDVLQRALMAILGTLKFKMGAIYLLKEAVEDQWLLELAAHHGFSPSLVNCIKFLSTPAEVVSNYYYNKPVRWFPSSKIVFAQLRERMRAEGIEEIISISLMSQKKVLGLLYVSNDGLYQLKQDRGEFLTAIGHQLGVSIENAQLFDSIERAKGELEISFDAIQHSIFLVDTRMRIYRVNKTSEMVYGSAESLVGKKYTNILYGFEQPHPECAIWACLWGAQPVQREGPHPRWGGYYHYYAFPVFNATGTMERVVYYEKDVTEARKIEQRFQQTERLKALGTLAAGIAHEIRNPLATINFNTQMLQRELTLDANQEQMFTDMVQQIKKIDKIVQQVLHFARPREPQFMPNQLNEILRYCHDLARVSLRKANVDVTLDLANNLPSIIMDFNQICQVVMNLIINAIEAMPEGGRLSLKTYRYDGPPDNLILELADTGPGILEEDRGRIFDPFFTRKPEGTGLGLSICRQIVEKHGAYIDMDSVPGEGTTFRIIFPVRSRVLEGDAVSS